MHNSKREMQNCIRYLHYAFHVSVRYGILEIWACCYQEVVNMVKGISRQVIVVHSPDQKLFEQAIFILKDGAVQDGGVTDDALLKEARRLIRQGAPSGSREKWGPVWAAGGAFVTALVWLLTSVL